jgi:hypothetical protein
VSGDPGPDLDEDAVTRAAAELLEAAGRPYGWDGLTWYEMEAWRTIARRTIRAYRG